MANEKNSFIFYKSFYDAIKSIPEQQQLKLYNAIMEYTFTDNEIKIDDGIVNGMFTLIKPNIDSANARYWASIENGKKGGRPKKETQQKPKQNLSESKKKVDVDVDEDVNVELKENKKRKFTKPTLEEINQYILEKQLKVNGKQFYDYFEEGGWKDSKGNQVKNWKQKLLTWNKYAEQSTTKKQSYEQRQYDDLSFLYANQK